MSFLMDRAVLRERARKFLEQREGLGVLAGATWKLDEDFLTDVLQVWRDEVLVDELRKRDRW